MEREFKGMVKKKIDGETRGEIDQGGWLDPLNKLWDGKPHGQVSSYLTPHELR